MMFQVEPSSLPISISISSDGDSRSSCPVEPELENQRRKIVVEHTSYSLLWLPLEEDEPPHPDDAPFLAMPGQEYSDFEDDISESESESDSDYDLYTAPDSTEVDPDDEPICGENLSSIIHVTSLTNFAQTAPVLAFASRLSGPRPNLLSFFSQESQ